MLMPARLVAIARPLGLLAGDAADHRRQEEHDVRRPVERRQQVDRVVDVRHHVVIAHPRPDVRLERLVAVGPEVANERERRYCPPTR